MERNALGAGPQATRSDAEVPLRAPAFRLHDRQFLDDEVQRAFHREIQRRPPPAQSPNLCLTGPPDQEFVDQRPFRV
ncbi:hypothetical protein [Streptomyces aureus]|uniref:hypothetical protein n=1 Tax=Streptomyces aureus TaxID=193461 RepID=UPI0006E26E9F|nr:hypothetical protein [Streptomyces aureus]